MSKIINCVMLIDDHQPTNILHRIAIENTGFVENIIIYKKAYNALNYLKNSAKKDYILPSIIFLDINMPGMNGWEFLQAYKQLDDSKRSHTLLLMLSTSTHPDDLSKAEEEEIVQDYIYKPLDEKLMAEVVQKYFVLPI